MKLYRVFLFSDLWLSFVPWIKKNCLACEYCKVAKTYKSHFFIICLSVCPFITNLSRLLLKNYWCNLSKLDWNDQYQVCWHFPVLWFLPDLWPFNFFLFIQSFVQTTSHKLMQFKWNFTRLINTSSSCAKFMGFPVEWFLAELHSSYNMLQSSNNILEQTGQSPVNTTV
jgi:hypothetical protein